MSCKISGKDDVMILTNLTYIDPDFEKKEGVIEINDGKIAGFENTDGEKLDMGGLLALPGFVDIHSHGGSYCDFCDGNSESLDKLSVHYARHGVTSVCPTTMTFPFERLKEIFKAVADFKGEEKGASFLKINMEGPFISKEKCGAQCPDFIQTPDIEKLRALNEIYPIALCDVAPETENALAFALEAKELCTVSIAHTNATYDEVKKALEKGFTHATHFLNAMTPFTSRAPGVVGAVMESDSVTAEIICDGHHLAQGTLRLLFKIFGQDRLCVISDSMSSADCPDGDYTLGGQRVIVKDKKAMLPDGTIAGSTTNLFDEFRNLLAFGIPFTMALRACTINPARVAGADSFCGSLEKGKNADIIFVDEKMELKAVMIKGKFFTA